MNEDYDSLPGYELTPREKEVAKAIVESAVAVHRRLGAGLLEHVYEVCLCHELKTRGYKTQRQLWLPVKYDGIIFEDAYRIDVLVDELICELKASDETTDLHKAQLRTYLKMSDKSVGFLLNFNVEWMKHGMRRVVLARLATT